MLSDGSVEIAVQRKTTHTTQSFSIVCLTIQHNRKKLGCCENLSRSELRTNEQV